MLKVPSKHQNLQRKQIQPIPLHHSASPMYQSKQNSFNIRSNSLCLEKSDIMKFVSDAFKSTKIEKKSETIDCEKFVYRTSFDFLSNFKKQSLHESTCNMNNLVKKRQKKSINAWNSNEVSNSLKLSKHKESSFKSVAEYGNNQKHKILIRVLKPKQIVETNIMANQESSILLTKEGQQRLCVKNQDLNFLNIENSLNQQKQMLGEQKEVARFAKLLISNLNRRKKYSSFGGENFMKIRI